METPKKRRSSKRSCLPTALSLPVDSNGISARSVTKGQLIKMLHRSPSIRKAEKEEALAREFDGSNPRSLRGFRSSLGSVQISWQSGGKWPGRPQALGYPPPSYKTLPPL